MKSRYEHSVSNKEAEKIGKRAGVRLFNEYLKTEMPRIRETYAKLFVLTLHYGMGFGEKRIRKVLKDLAEMSCDMYNLAVVWRESVYKSHSCPKCGTRLIDGYNQPIDVDEALLMGRTWLFCKTCGLHVAYVTPYNGPLKPGTMGGYWNGGKNK